MNARDVIQEGYEKYKSAPFKVAEFHHWTVIVSNRGHLEELARASDKALSSLEAINDQIQVEYTLGPEVHHNPYHVAVVRSHLTRNIDVLYPEIRDEIVTSFAEVLDLKGNEWKSVPALIVMEKVICRTSNRVFVGLPLCRNQDWIDFNIKCTIDAVKGGLAIGLLPQFMRRQVNATSLSYYGVKLLGPIIEERQKYMNKYGTMWDDKPEAEGPELMPECLTTRVLVVNFTAIHSFTQALFYLAGNPQYIQPLREEKDGWSKVALSKMRKVDSFLKECQRVEGIAAGNCSRIWLHARLIVITHSSVTLSRKRFYKNPEVFEPFRFANISEESESGPKHQLASTTTEYLAFGHGRRAPGRFFAANELKSMLAHIVVTYDVKLEENAPYPASLRIGKMIAANPRAKVMF
ncbi:cytochrome P450 [Imleria badia]|nr:cytochrome P450 [Imleria badia]